MSMELIKARSALLSNFEVLTLLKELEADQLAKQKTALRIKKEDDERASLLGAKDTSFSNASSILPEDVCENLRTVEFEAIKYLSADYQPTNSQDAESIQKLIQDLAPYDLTKAEKLQIINLAPKETVELYVIVEEIEDRLGESLNEVISIVKASLLDRTPKAEDVGDHAGRGFVNRSAEDYREGWDDENDAMVVEDDYQDDGAGAGIEGDLEEGDDD